VSLKDRREGRIGRDFPREYIPARPNNDKRFGRRRGGFAGPVLIACAVIAVLVAADYLMNAGKIYRGVEVGTVALGGQTPAEARERVQERSTGALREFELAGPERFTRTADEMGVEFNVDETVEEAYAVGREGNMLERLGQRGRALVLGVTIAPDVDYRAQSARAEIEEVASRLDKEPREAVVNIYGAEAEVIGSQEGYKLDKAATMRNVNAAVEDMSGEVKIAGEVLKPEITTQEAAAAEERVRSATAEQLVFVHEGERWTLSPADVGSSLDVTRNNGELEVSMNRDRLDERLANVYADLTAKPVEAGYEFRGDSIAVTPSKEGRSVEKETLLDAVEGGLFEGKREYEVATVVDKPQFTTSQAESMKPTELLGSYRTNYSIVEDLDGKRAENLEIASGAVNGTFLAPGEVFSMNETVQDEKYHKTHVIIEGREETEEGGGLCQVTSTLYNAVNYAGLDVVERHPHATQLPYIRPGLDATVWFGALDMKFENTTDGYILLQEYVSDDGYIYANVYGVPDNVDVKLRSKPLYRTADGAKWVTYMTRTEDGKVTYDGELHTDTYAALIDEDGEKLKADEIPIAAVNP
jgi:vancomycin resistance protein YoaR